MAFYGIRKILEARKASPKVLTASVRIMEYPRRSNSGAEVIGPILRAYFDLDHPKKRDRDLLFICHQVVHSYIFSTAVGYSSGFEGIYFASDRLRNKCLFFIAAETLIKAFRMVGTDPDAEFSPWVEERLPNHRVQTAFPRPEPRLTIASTGRLTASGDARGCSKNEETKGCTRPPDAYRVLGSDADAWDAPAKRTGPRPAKRNFGRALFA